MSNHHGRGLHVKEQRAFDNLVRKAFGAGDTKMKPAAQHLLLIPSKLRPKTDKLAIALCEHSDLVQSMLNIYRDISTLIYLP